MINPASIDDLINASQSFSNTAVIRIPLHTGIIDRFFVKDLLFQCCSKRPYVISLNKEIKQNGVYVIINSLSNEFYIGSTGNVFKRIKDHRNRLSANIHMSRNLQDSYNRTQKAYFDMVVIFTNDREEAYDVEQFFIDYFNGKKGFLNVALDVRKPQLGRPLNEKQRAILDYHNKNKNYTDTVRKNMSDARKNSPTFMEMFKQVRELVKRKVEINGIIYESVTDAARQNGIHRDTIYNRLKSDPSCYQYV